MKDNQIDGLNFLICLSIIYGTIAITIQLSF